MASQDTPLGLSDVQAYADGGKQQSCAGVSEVGPTGEPPRGVDNKRYFRGRAVPASVVCGSHDLQTVFSRGKHGERQMQVAFFVY